MSRTDSIMDAIESLDSSVDDHWTSSGKPRMGMLKELSGIDDLTRDEVDAVIPADLDRETASEILGSRPIGPEVAEADGDGGRGRDGGQSTDASSSAEASEMSAAEALKTELKEKICLCEKTIEEQTAIRVDADNAIKTANAALAALGRQMARLFPAPTPAETVRAYHKKQQEIRAANAEAAGVPVGRSMGGSSPLDRAMRSNRRIGANRPEPLPLAGK